MLSIPCEKIPGNSPWHYIELIKRHTEAESDGEGSDGAGCGSMQTLELWGLQVFFEHLLSVAGMDGKLAAKVSFNRRSKSAQKT